MLSEAATPTLISEGTKVQGAVVTVAAAGVYGIVEGELIQQSLELLQVGKTGWINGSINSEGPVLIEGKVDGDITSTTKISLTSTASVRGKLRAPSIEIRAGAIFEGDLVMLPNVAKTEKLPEKTTEKPERTRVKKAA